MKNIKSISLIVLMFLSIQISYVQAGELINKQLPEYLKMDLQFRYRFEGKNNFDFNSSNDDRDNLQLFRTRLSLDYMPIKQVELFAQMQDSRVANLSTGAKSNYSHPMDVRQAYLSLKQSPMSLTFGRQELSYGSQRLLGAFDWSNIAQTFDSGKISFALTDPNLKVDIFGGNLTPNDPTGKNDFFDNPTVKDTLGGYYAVYTPNKDFIYDQYLLKRKTNKNISFGPSGSAELDEYTMGGRVVGKNLKGFDFEFETAGQWGDFDAKSIQAMMAVGVVGYTFNMPWKPRTAFEFDYASGDKDSSDNKRTTFDNLYPTNHLHYGYMDVISLQNLNDYRFQLSANPTDKIKLQSDLHMIYLDTYKDSFYSAGRTVSRTAIAANGNNLSTHIGEEIDLTMNYKINKQAVFLLGYSHLWAGDYLAQTGANDDADFIYTQVTINL